VVGGVVRAFAEVRGLFVEEDWVVGFGDEEDAD